jgi:hypothetical protein
MTSITARPLYAPGNKSGTHSTGSWEKCTADCGLVEKWTADCGLVEKCTTDCGLVEKCTADCGLVEKRKASSVLEIKPRFLGPAVNVEQGKWNLAHITYYMGVGETC